MQSIQPEQFLTAQIQSVQEQSVQGDVQVQLVANASVQVHVQIMIQAHAQIRIKSKPTPKITFKFKPRFTFKSDSEPSVSASSNMTERTFKMQVGCPWMLRSCKWTLACARGNQCTPGSHLNSDMFITRTYASPIVLLSLALAGSVSTFTACTSPTPNTSQDPKPSLR